MDQLLNPVNGGTGYLWWVLPIIALISAILIILFGNGR
jgi:hypothetical protein